MHHYVWGSRGGAACVRGNVEKMRNLPATRTAPVRAVFRRGRFASRTIGKSDKAALEISRFYTCHCEKVGTGSIN